MVSSENDKTIAAYEKHAQRYAESTIGVVHGVLKEWLDQAVQNLPNDAKIFEIGSGSGRDASYLGEKGYATQCSDATRAFIVMLQERGLDAKKFNAIDDEFTESYDLILADAVLLHFTKPQTKEIVDKVFRSLSGSGRFAFTVKCGEGEEWTGEKLGASRYFNFWKEDDLAELLYESGFNTVSIVVGGSSTAKEWLHVIAQK